jgi:ribonuclease M5
MERIKLKQALVVEGKYDKIKLEALIDGVILPVNGFRVFKDKQLQGLIRTLSNTCGIVLLTDSDAAGFKIRALVADIARGGEVLNAYAPDIPGKERRKERPSAEGKLGVEGLSVEILREVLLRAGASGKDKDKAPAITRLDFYEAGLSGGKDSASKRRRLYARLGLPSRLSASAALPVLNQILTREEFLKIARL